MWALPIAAGILLLIVYEEDKAHASVRPSGSGKGKTSVTRAKGATSPKLHYNFYPPAGEVMVADDPSWAWDGQQWTHNGRPGFPDGMLLVGVPGGPLDGWAYDWNTGAWHEPGFIHSNFYPPAGSVGVKGDSSWTWDGSQWLKNGKPSFPKGQTLVGLTGGPLDGWSYDWKLQVWAEPGAIKALVANKDAIISQKKSSGGNVITNTLQALMQKAAGGSSSGPPTAVAPAPSAPSSQTSPITVTSVPASSSAPASAPSQASVIKAVSSLAQNPDPHPSQIAQVASMAQDAGMHQTAATLANKAQQKAAAQGSTISDVTSQYAQPSGGGSSPITMSDAQGSTITQTSVPAISVAQSANDLEASLHALEHSNAPTSSPTPAPTMTFPPEVITASTPDMTFDAEVITHTLPSALDGVSDDDWTHFTNQMESIGNKVSDKWELGLWKIGARRLQDLGMATNARQVNKDGKSVWIADFVPPLSLQIFVNDEHLQYDTFAKEMQYLLNGINDRGNSGKIPLDIHGNSPTRSGLLAVAKIAGFQGLDSFMKADSRDWDKFPATRDAFLKFNGMF